VEKPLADQTYVQTALEQTGALKKFKRATVEVYRPLLSGGWQTHGKASVSKDQIPAYDLDITPQNTYQGVGIEGRRVVLPQHFTYDLNRGFAAGGLCFAGRGFF
jgi:hypothetical protein